MGLKHLDHKIDAQGGLAATGCLHFAGWWRQLAINNDDVVVLMPYSAATAKEIVGVSQRCLDYWDEKAVVRPSVQVAKGKGTERRYSFDDLLRLTLVKRLRDAGLSLQRVRKGLEKLRKRWPRKDPLLDEHLVTDGVTFFRVKGALVEDVLANGQLVFGIIAVGQIRADLKARIIELSNEELHARGKRLG